jgi:hypothetical protein
MNRLLLVALFGLLAASAVIAFGQAPLWLWLGTRGVWNAIALAGCVLAAAAFRPGEYLWWAWALNAISFGLPLLWQLTGGVPEAVSRGPVTGLAAVVIASQVVVNAAGVAGAALFTFAFLRSGLLPGAGTRARTAAIVCAATVICLVLGVPTLFLDLEPGPPVARLASLLSLGGDATCFAVATPLVLIALELRGGALAATWWLLAASDLGWLVYDATDALLGGEGSRRAEVIVFAVSLAMFGAGLSHRRAVRAADAGAVEGAT